MKHILTMNLVLAALVAGTAIPNVNKKGPLMERHLPTAVELSRALQRRNPIEGNDDDDAIAYAWTNENKKRADGSDDDDAIAYAWTNENKKRADGNDDDDAIAYAWTNEN